MRPFEISITPRNFRFLFSLLCCAGLLGAGCQSFNKPASDSLASVTITGKSVDQIAEATRAVFAVHGFEGSETGPGKFTYERAGTRANNLAYGSAMFNEAVTIRVQVTATPQDAVSTLIACNAWLVEDEADPVFADSHKVRQLSKWPYDQLLADIKAQLGE